MARVKYGMVGGPETVKELGRDSEGLLQEFDRNTLYLSVAVEVFKEEFKHLTGLDWANRSNQPVKSKYTYIEDGRNSLLWGWRNAVSKPL